MERRLLHPGTLKALGKAGERGVEWQAALPSVIEIGFPNLKQGLNSTCICMFFPPPIGSLGKTVSLSFERESYIYPKEKLPMLSLQTAHSSLNGQ